MSIVRGRLKNGKVEFDEPLPSGWQDGAEVETRLTSVEQADDWGMREEDWPTTPEGIAEWLVWLNSREPVFDTDEEVEAFERVLAEQKAWQKSQWDKWTREVEEQTR